MGAGHGLSAGCCRAGHRRSPACCRARSCFFWSLDSGSSSSPSRASLQSGERGLLAGPGATYFPFSDPFLLCFLLRTFPRERAGVPEGMCGASAGVICLGSYLVRGCVMAGGGRRRRRTDPFKETQQSYFLNSCLQGRELMLVWHNQGVPGRDTP